MKLQDEIFYWLSDHANTVAFRIKREDKIQNITYQKFASDVYTLRDRYMACESRNIAIIGTTCYEWFCNTYACLLSGKRVLICDALLPTEELNTVLSYMEIEEVVYSKDLPELNSEISQSIKTEYFYEVDEKEQIDFNEYSFGNSDNELLEGDLVCLTSGTTNQAKGVVISTKALCCNANNLAQVLVGEREDIVYTSLPLHHLYAVAKTLSFFRIGVTLCLGSMRTVVRDLEIYRPQILLTVPTVVDYLDKVNCFNSEITAIAVSGCKCEMHVEEECLARNIYLQNIYGSSETAGGIALNLPGDAIDVLSLLPGIHARIAPDDEILLQPAGMMTEYYKSPEETNEKIHDGWLYTGDVGYLDEQNKLHITGRKKDIIAMKNGDKIYCAETDEQLGALEGVEEAAVIYPNEVLVAAVYPKKGFTEEEIRKSLDQYNRNQQLIRRINRLWILEEPLPRTTTGKMMRNKLTSKYITLFEQTDRI